jgi:hypothetical protein
MAMTAEMFSLSPHVAVIDVSVDITDVHISTWLYFGPFKTKEDAQSWIESLRMCHVEKEWRSEDETTPAHLSCEIMMTDVRSVNQFGGGKGATIDPGSPADTALRLHVHVANKIRTSLGALLVSELTPASEPD